MARSNDYGGTPTLRDNQQSVLMEGSGAKADQTLPHNICGTAGQIWKVALQSAHVPLTFLNFPTSHVSWRQTGPAQDWAKIPVPGKRVMDLRDLVAHLNEVPILKDKITAHLSGDDEGVVFTKLANTDIKFSARYTSYFGLNTSSMSTDLKTITGSAVQDLFQGTRVLRLMVNVIEASIVGSQQAKLLSLITVNEEAEQLSYIHWHATPQLEWHRVEQTQIQQLSYSLTDQYSKLLEFPPSNKLQFQLRFKLYSLNA